MRRPTLGDALLTSAIVAMFGITVWGIQAMEKESNLTQRRTCAEAHSDYIARARANGQCLQTPGCWIMADDILRMNQARDAAAAACPISVMTK